MVQRIQDTLSVLYIYRGLSGVTRGQQTHRFICNGSEPLTSKTRGQYPDPYIASGQFVDGGRKGNGLGTCWGDIRCGRSIGTTYKKRGPSMSRSFYNNV